MTLRNVDETESIARKCINNTVRVEATEKKWTDEPDIKRANADVNNVRSGAQARLHDDAYTALIAPEETGFSTVEVSVEAEPSGMDEFSGAGVREAEDGKPGGQAYVSSTARTAAVRGALGAGEAKVGSE